MSKLSRPKLLRLPLLAVLLALFAGMYTASPAMAADSFTVNADRATPTDSGVELFDGWLGTVLSTADDVSCGVESPYPCNGLDAYGSDRTCASFGLVCTAPDLPAWALLVRVENGPWQVANTGSRVTGPGRVFFQYNDQDYGDNSGGFSVEVLTEFPDGDGLAVTSISSSPASVGPGGTSVSYDDLPAEIPLGYPTQSILATAPLRSSPLRSSPLRSSPLRSSPLRSSPLRSSPLRSSELGPISLASIPLRSSSWSELLAGTPLDAPPAAITLDQVYSLDPLPANIAALTLDDIDLARSPLRSSSIGALLLGNVPLSKLRAPFDDGSWCPSLGLDPGCDITGKTLLSVEAKGRTVDLSNLLLAGDGIDISGSPLASIKLTDLEFSATFRRLATTDLSAYQTVGDLVAALPVRDIDRLRLGDLLPAIVAPKELPYELADTATLLDPATPNLADRYSYSVTTEVPCDAGFFHLDYEIPFGAHFVSGSATAFYDGESHDLNDPFTGEGNEPPGSDFTIEPIEGALECSPGGPPLTVVTTILVDPPPHLGSAPISVVARIPADLYARTGGATTVTDKYDAGATEATAKTIGTDGLQTGYIAPGIDDVDVYKLPAPPVGSTVTMVLSGLPADYDLTVTGPPTGIDAAPLRSSPLRSSPLRSSEIGDDRYGAGTDTIAPALLQDLPLRSSDLATSPLRSSSINRGLTTESASFTVTADDVGKSFYVKVSGYNGASNNDPYILRAKVQAPTIAPQCRARRTLTGGTKGTFPTLPLATSTKTLFLFNQQRLAQLYPNADIAALRGQLATLAARPEVAGAVIPIENDSTLPTDAAYAAWDADPCSESAANSVAKRIREVIGHVSANLNDLRSIVVIGGDEVIPQARVQDLTSVANESEEAGSVVFGGKDAALSRSLRDGYLMTDDLYGDFAPSAAIGGQSYVPDVALGRLVETPAEIAGQLTAYTAANGALNVSTAHVAGYDFLTDGAQAILDKLRALPNLTATSDISETWTAADALRALNRTAPGISSVNGHYDHYRGMPASAFNGLVPNLFSSSQVSPAAASLIFTAGCHAGLSVSDVGVPDAGTADAARLLDWAQKIGRSGGAYIANTTYGYGDTDTVAYTERLLELLSDGIASQKVTAGQALMLAKQRYAAEQQTPGVYDRKASMGLTYYGLPFFKVGPTGAEGASTLPVAPSGSTTVQSDTFDVTPTFQIHETPTGDQYYTANNEPPQVTHHRPVEPRVTVDVTAADRLPVHGAIVETLKEERQSFFHPLFSEPVIDTSATADPGPDFTGVFPVSIQRNTRTGSSTGLRDLLVLAAGQFNDDRSTQKLFRHIAGHVLRSGSTDFDPPTMTNVEARVVNGVATIKAFATTNDTVRGVALVLVSGDDDWRLVEMTRSGNTWTGTLNVPNNNDISYIVQLADSAGNVGVSTNKGPGYTEVPAFAPVAANPVVPSTPATTPPSTPPSTPVTTPPTTPATTPPPAPVLAPSAPVPASTWYRVPVTITLNAPGRSGVTYMVKIDSGTPFKYTAPFKFSTEGRHTITATGSDRSVATRAINYDDDLPLVKGFLSPGATVEGFIPGPVTVSWICTDKDSGVAKCPAPIRITTEGMGLAPTSGDFGRDVAGNIAYGKIYPQNVDLYAPTGAIDQLRTLKTITVAGKAVKVVSGTAADSLAGNRSVVVTYTTTTSPVKTTTVTAAVSCSATTRRACTWTATLPAKGTWRVVAKVTDRAGRVTSVTRSDTLTVS